MYFACWLDPLGAAGLPGCGVPSMRAGLLRRPGGSSALGEGGCAPEGGKRDGFRALCFKTNLFQIT